ncbi:unnamed protein product [Caenorhabditis bovis]|uniref:Uncharacterized protein n=1 Tax=Caenorhabditis bovis TaxID=2654633 RepID=A0A8S1EEE3_9PELO|nr:unnamed protein product [Caenorhabditis bovis]
MTKDEEEKKRKKKKKVMRTRNTLRDITNYDGRERARGSMFDDYIQKILAFLPPTYPVEYVTREEALKSIHGYMMCLVPDMEERLSKDNGYRIRRYIPVDGRNRSVWVHAGDPENNEIWARQHIIEQEHLKREKAEAMKTDSQIDEDAKPVKIE